MATPSLSYQNKFSTTLSSGVIASDTTIPLTAVPTPTEGYLVLEPDSSTAWEVIYYTSKTGSGVICPSAAAGRGVGGSTAASHSQGATVRMDSTAEMFTSLQDATGLTGLHRYGTDGTWFDYVASGCVWTADAAGSTRLASMTSGVAYINGRRHTVAAVTSRTFTASKDTYIDLLYSVVDNVATPVYTEVANNAASPALAANSIRIGIIVTGVSSIAAAASINQGQEDRVLPIASSIPYAVTDSLGNLICPRDPNRRILGKRQIVANFTNATTPALTDVTGLNTTVNVPTGRKVKISVDGNYVTASGAAGNSFALSILDVTSSVEVHNKLTTIPVAGYATNPHGSTVVTPAASGARNYKLQFTQSAAGTFTLAATATAPAYLLVELV
jgi:hypothetical protein